MECCCKQGPAGAMFRQPGPLLRAALYVAVAWTAGALQVGLSLPCSSLSAEGRKQWRHSRIALPPPYSLGVDLNPVYDEKMRLDAKMFAAKDDEPRAGLPIGFDARKVWKNCSSIGRIVDQGCCGSCWAYASANAMTDRQCILNGEQFEYSPEHLLSCSKMQNRTTGCLGGDPADAFDFWTTRGVVSGGGFNTSQGCVPYSYPPSGAQCHLLTATTECLDQCTRTYPHTFKGDLHYGDRYMLLPFNRSTVMQAEIMHGGPIVAILDTYEDFKCYEGGVYEHVAGAYQGAHAVRLIGWGTENGVPYWLAANSWGRTWGERGFFRIKRGTNECNIESIRVVAGYPQKADHRDQAVRE